MELDEFVRATLTQIINGVDQAKKDHPDRIAVRVNRGGHHKSDCFEKHGGNCIGILMVKGGQRRLDIETDIRNNGDA